MKFNQIGLAILAAVFFSPALAYPHGSPLPVIPASSAPQNLIPEGRVNDITGKTAAQQENGYPLALTYLRRETGSQLIYLGNAGGVLGYLGFGPNNTEQAFYIWPNGVDFVVGTLFDSAGNDVSKIQIAAMKNRYEKALSGKKISIADVPIRHTPNAIFDGGANKIPFMHHILDRPGMSYLKIGGDGGTPSYLVKNGSPGAILASGKLGVAQMFYVAPTGRDAVAGVMFGEYGRDITSTEMLQMSKKVRAFLKNKNPTANNAPTKSGVSDPPTQKPSHTIPTGQISVPHNNNPITASDFYSAVKYTASFSVGKPSAPGVWMVSDVQCPHCHAAWAALQPLVLAGKIRLRIILVDDEPSSEPYTISILTQPNPGLAWLRGWGDTANLSDIPAPPNAHSAAYKEASSWLSDNMQFVQKLGITGTPFLAYTDKSGEFFAEQGPVSVTNFVSSIDK